MPLRCLAIKRLQHASCGVAAVAGTGDGDLVAAGVNDDAEPAFDLRQILSIRADQRGRGAVVVEVDDDLGLWRDRHVAVRFAAGSKRW